MEQEPLTPTHSNANPNRTDLGIPPRTTIILIVLSLIFGALGGVYGSRHFGNTNPSQGGTVVVQEESGTVDVVKKASNAVVSIIISKDLSKAQNFSFNPFDQNPFSPFYFSQQPSQPTTPNVQQVGAGTGFFVSSDGLILTNKHVVADEQASYSVLTQDGKSYDAKVLARDPVNDLAIVKIDIKNSPTLTLADSSQIQIGQTVVAIGNSLGQYQNSVTKGIVSGIGRSITAGGNGSSEQLEGVIQTDAAINPGNSGGPLLNLAGQVIGINTAVDQQGQSLGFALAANDAKKALDSFQKTGKIQRPFLGIHYLTITPDLVQEQKLGRDHGALIVSSGGEAAVVPGSPADKAGLTAGDIILEINGQPLDENHTLAGQLKNFNPGDNVTLKVFHQGSEKTVTVTLGQAG